MNAPGSLSEMERVEIERNAYAAEVEILQESLADIELALEDRGWIALSQHAAEEFTREGRRRAAGLCRILSVQNPLIKRGIAVRVGYIWGSGLDIDAKDTDVNTVVQDFLDANEASYCGSQAREEAERTLATDGDLFRALFTSPLAGTVSVRSIDPNEIDEILTNPEDSKEPWFYLRSYTTTVIERGYSGLTRRRPERRRVIYPALGYRPASRPKSIDGIPVAWDTPVQHVAVNRIDGWSFGIGDAYASIFFARAYNEFLTDWAKLMKSLSRFAWRLTAKRTGSAQRAAIEARRVANLPAPRDPPSNAGATAVSSDAQLEAIPKTGATIDAESGRPLAGMVAAALGVPVTMLLADPGQTGARAVAETLDDPTKHEMNLRRALHEAADRAVLQYVLMQSVKAPRGALRGTVRINDRGREVIELAGDVDESINFQWPSLDKVDIKTIVDAIVAADGTEKIPPPVIARLLLAALGVDEIDEVMKDLVDDDGNWIDPAVTAGDDAARRFRNGEDPVEDL